MCSGHFVYSQPACEIDINATGNTVGYNPGLRLESRGRIHVWAWLLCVRGHIRCRVMLLCVCNRISNSRRVRACKVGFVVGTEMVLCRFKVLS